MRVLVCGGRRFANKALLTRMLNTLHAFEPFTLLIHGLATGADRMAMHWAIDHNVPQEGHAAAWGDLSHPDALIRTRPDGSRYDARAGLRRNSRMLEEKPKLVIAFPGGDGTADMVKKARAAGITVMEVV
jgi:UDP-N-acetylmuramoylalanine-D-glutamate ligase